MFTSKRNFALFVVLIVLSLFGTQSAFAHPCEGKITSADIQSFLERQEEILIKRSEALENGIYVALPAYIYEGHCNDTITDSMINHYLINSANAYSLFKNALNGKSEINERRIQVPSATV